MSREIFVLHFLSWSMIALALYDVWARWAHSDPAAGLFLPSNDAVPFALLTAAGFEVAARALTLLSKSKPAHGPTQP